MGVAVDEIEVLSGIFDSWREHNPDQKIGEKPSLLDYYNGSLEHFPIEKDLEGEEFRLVDEDYELFDCDWGRIDFQLECKKEGNDYYRYVRSLNIALGDDYYMKPIQLPLHELGKLQKLERLDISCFAPMQLPLHELGELQKLERLYISCYSWQNTEKCPIELIGNFPFDKFTQLKTLYLNLFWIEDERFVETFRYYGDPPSQSSSSDDSSSDDGEEGSGYHEYTNNMKRITPCYGLSPEKLKGIGKLSNLENLTIAGVKDGLDLSFFAELEKMKSLKELRLVNCDQDSPIWKKPGMETRYSFLQVTDQLPPDIQQRIFEDVKNTFPKFPIPREIDYDSEDWDIDDDPYSKGKRAEVESSAKLEELLQARKFLPELQLFENKFFEYDYSTDTEANELEAYHEAY